jgi:hypothetical protein
MTNENLSIHAVREEDIERKRYWVSVHADSSDFTQRHQADQDRQEFLRVFKNGIAPYCSAENF